VSTSPPLIVECHEKLGA